MNKINSRILLYYNNKKKRIIFINIKIFTTLKIHKKINFEIKISPFVNTYILSNITLSFRHIINKENIWICYSFYI